MTKRVLGLILGCSITLTGALAVSAGRVDGGQPGNTVASSHSTGHVLKPNVFWPDDPSPRR